MKPNDKAYQTAADAISLDTVFDLSKKECFDIAKVALDAAYAAQFPPSEDYAGLVEWLRNKAESLSEIYPPEAEAADALEALLAKLNNKPKPSEDYAGLIEALRAFDEELLNAQPHSCEQTAKQAADAIEALLAERKSLTAAVLLSERQNDILTGDIDRLRVERNANIREKGKEDE